MKRKLLTSLLSVVAATLAVGQAVGQTVGVKTNLLSDVTTTLHAAAEFPLGPKTTGDLSFGLNPWTLSGDKKLRHWMLQPELRRYFCQRTSGSFVAFHLMGGEFNAGNVKLPLGIAPTLRHNRYEGWFLGGGIGYGYQWPLSRHLSLEAEVAVGYDYLKYRRYPCATCGTKLGDGHYHYVGPTKIAFNVIYSINKEARSKEMRSKETATAASLLPTSILPYSLPSSSILGGRAAVSDAAIGAAGQSLVLSMKLSLDQLQLKQSQTVVLRPVLRAADSTTVARFRPILINSHTQHVLHKRGIHNANYPDAIEVERRNGQPQTFGYLAEIPLEPWMDEYTLELEEDLCGCGDLLADNSTPLLTQQKPEPTLAPAIGIALTPDDYKKEKQLQGRAYIDFRVNRTDLDPQYRRNPEELKKITATIDQVKGKADVELSGISIHGYASPEGSYQNNVRLAEGRAATLAEHIRRLYKMERSTISSTSTPEDWAGLRRYVEATALPERDALLAIIDGPLEPDPRNEAIRRQFPQRYQQLLAEVYPALRHSDYIINYSIRPYTLAESREVYRTHPQDLSLSEQMALAADAGLGSVQANAIILRAASLLPHNPRAQLLAAQVALQAQDYTRAETLLAPLPASPQRSYLLGAIRKMQHRYDEALSLMQEAHDGGIPQAAAQTEEINRLK